MATVRALLVTHAHDGQADLYEWAGMNAGDTVEWLRLPIKADKTVHVYAAGGVLGGTVTIEGTLETATSPSNPFTINDSRGEGNPLTFTTTDGRTVHEAVIQIRPSLGAGVAN